MTFGARSESKVNLSVGPGSYNPENAEKIVKHSAKKTDFAKSPPRKSI